MKKATRMETVLSSSHAACELTEGSWLDFREDVRKVEPELFQLLEHLNPGKKLKLIKARYLYGEKITDFGTICVPDKNGKPRRLDDPNVSQHLKDELSYCPTPLILQLTNASEVFVDTEERIAPLNVFSPGDLYGLYEILVPFTGCPAVPCWSTTSGARSVFLASKVADAICHKKLREEFGVSGQPPKKLSDEWSIFRAIANSARKESPWSCEILIFTKDWFKERDNDINWLKFQNFLFKKAWWQSRSSRAQIEYTIMWESFAKAICAKNLKPNPYIVDTVKHLMLLTIGTTPGFRAATDDEVIMPTKIIEKAYTEVYGLNGYAAIIMHPHILNSQGSTSPIYYSMAYPTLIEGTPFIRKPCNILMEIREVRTLMQTLQRLLESYEERIYEALKNVNFEYFHSDDDRLGEIQNSQIIATSDSIMSAALNTRFKGKKFPSYGPFFRGCIRVSK
jgi:hypothetical protein